MVSCPVRPLFSHFGKRLKSGRGSTFFKEDRHAVFTMSDEFSFIIVFFDLDHAFPAHSVPALAVQWKFYSAGSASSHAPIRDRNRRRLASARYHDEDRPPPRCGWGLHPDLEAVGLDGLLEDLGDAGLSCAKS